jgi:NHL repeat
MGRLSNVGLQSGLALLALAPACMPPIGMSMTPSPTSFGTSAPSSPAPIRYEATVIVADARWADWLAVGETELFLARNMRGARANGTRSSIAAVPLSGGDPVELPGTETFGVEISGIAVSKNIVYFSRVGGPALRDSGVFRYSSGRLVAVTTNSLSSPAGLAINNAGDLFIADTSGGRVQRLSGGTMTTYAGRAGCGDRNPGPGPATEAALCGPELLALSATGDLYVAGRGATWVARVDTAGTLSVVVKDFGPSSLAIDAKGTLLAGDGAKRRLVSFDAAGRATVVADDLGFISAISVGTDGSIYVLHSIATGGAPLERVTRLRRV